MWSAGLEGIGATTYNCVHGEMLKRRSLDSKGLVNYGISIRALKVHYVVLGQKKKKTK